MDECGFEARLRHLEHVLVGEQKKDLSSSSSVALQKRIEELRGELQRVYKNRKSLQDFARKYEDHAALLNPAMSTFHMEREILGPDVKMALVIAAHDDLHDHFTKVGQIKSLEHVVSGVGLEELDTAGSELAGLELTHAEQEKQLQAISQTLSKLMDNYNGTVNTLSEIFISWDDILTAMEVHVAKLERLGKGTKTDH